MAYTISQLEALEAAIATGALTVKHGDQQVTYQSSVDMIRLRNLMRSELGVAAPKKQAAIINPATGRGL